MIAGVSRKLEFAVYFATIVSFVVLYAMTDMKTIILVGLGSILGYGLGAFVGIKYQKARSREET